MMGEKFSQICASHSLTSFVSVRNIQIIEATNLFFLIIHSNHLRACKIVSKEFFTSRPMNKRRFYLLPGGSMLSINDCEPNCKFYYQAGSSDMWQVSHIKQTTSGHRYRRFRVQMELSKHSGERLGAYSCGNFCERKLYMAPSIILMRIQPYE